MPYQLAIDIPGGPAQPSFTYQSVEEALEATERGIEAGYLEIAGGITICTGPGTVYKVLSDEHIAAGMPQDKNPFVLFVQVGGGSLPPMGFQSDAGAMQALASALEDGGGYHGVLRHVAKVGHEYTFVVLSPGAIIMRMTHENFIERQKQAMADALRKRQEAADAVKPSGIIIPGN
jgi:hypothetical protein